MKNKDNMMDKTTRVTKEERFFDDLSRKQQESWWGHRTYAGQQRLLRRVEAAISFFSPIKHDTKLLEIGCGSGDFTAPLLEKLPLCEYYGMDISGGLLEQAKQRVKKEKVFFIKGDAENINPDIGKFDVALGTSVLHHLDVVKVLKGVYMLLNAGGKIFFLEPNMQNPQIWLERNIRCIGAAMQNTEDETAFYKKDLKSILGSCGFCNIYVEPFDFMHPLIPKPLVGALGGIFRLFEATPLVREFAGSLMITGEKPYDQQELNHKN